MSTDPSTHLSETESTAADPAFEAVKPPVDSTVAPAILPANDEDEFGQLNPLVIAAVGLILLAFLPFVASTRGSFLWLDDATLLDNPFMPVSDGIARFWTTADTAGRYEPLTMVSFWLEYKFVHLQPAAYRLINVLLHAVVVIFLWTLLRRLELQGAWLAAAVFAVHPVHTQAIAWISGRSIVLASMFYLASMLVYLRYLGITPVPPGSKTLLTLPSEPERLWGLAIALFACAVASNPVAVTLPLTIALVIWWKRARVTGEQWLMLLPFFAIAIGGGIWAGYAQSMSPLKHALLSAYGPTPIGDRVEFAVRAIAFYAVKIIAPIGLSFDYPRFQPSMSAFGISAAAVAIVLFGMLLLRKNLGRAPFTAVAIFVLAIVPALSILDAPSIRYSFVADFPQYLASAAIITLVVCAISRWALQNAAAAKVGTYLGGIVVIVFFALSVQASAKYVSPERLWIDTYKENKTSLLAANGYGEALRYGGHFPEARDWFEHAEKISAGDPRTKFNLGLTDEAEAFDQQRSGQTDKAAKSKLHAISHFEAALSLDPDFAPAAISLGDMRAAEKDEKGAIALYTQAVASAPMSIRARLNLAGALRLDGQLDAASQQLFDVLDINPNIPAAHTEMGNIYLQKKQVQDALNEWAKTAVLEPRNTTILLNYGAVLASSGQLELASKQFFAATRINPDLQPAYFNLGLVELKAGHNQDAVIHLNKAVELDPSDDRAKKLLSEAKNELKLLGPGTQPSTQQATSQPAMPFQSAR